MGELGLWDNWTVLASTVKERAGLLMHAYTPAHHVRSPWLQARGAKLWVGKLQNLGSQTDGTLDACVHAQSIVNDSLILSQHTCMFRSHLGTYKRATCSPAILPNPNHLTTPMSHLTSHEVLTFVTGPPTVAGLQQITVQMQRIPCLIL